MLIMRAVTAALLVQLAVLLFCAPAGAETWQSCRSPAVSIKDLRANAYSSCREARDVARRWRAARRSTRTVLGFRCATQRLTGSRRQVRCRYRGALNDARVQWVFAP